MYLYFENQSTFKMNRQFTSSGIAFRIWILTALLFGLGFCVYETYGFHQVNMLMYAGAFAASILGSIPAFIALLIFVPLINRAKKSWRVKFFRLLLIQFFITGCYGLLAAALDFPIANFNSEDWYSFLYTGLIVFASLFASTVLSSFFLLKDTSQFFSGNQFTNLTYNNIFLSLFQQIPKNNSTMETVNYSNQPEPQSQSNRILIKGLITAGLILLMLVPTIFISNLITERESRQKEVVKEVSSKWASAQTISGPYLVVPYNEPAVNSENKPIIIKKQLILLANDLRVNGNISPENRPRSIYKVLLYKSNLNLKGSFKPAWPADIDTANIDFTNAKICFGLSDFKGIEEEIVINFNGKKIALNPGLPLNDLDTIGLSAPVEMSFDAIKAGIAFDMQVKIKGSEQLHFMPLSANSKFELHSSWPNPSFDGNVLPNERQVNEKGFDAKWNFNQANLPFGTVLRQGSFNRSNLAFGVSMVQPADQYNKTMRSVKYAILFIGLTFALFFIVEIMQKKPFHPVQYVLVGLALVIFYTLLLSISEYLLFDQAYLIAAAATILLITMYAKSHFTSWKTAVVFGSVLSALYGFIFILIRLEDTALIVGSIGLFIVLALVMYVSRKINWYGSADLMIDKK